MGATIIGIVPFIKSKFQMHRQSSFIFFFCTAMFYFYKIPKFGRECLEKMPVC